jgi:hypothetical protein
MKSNEFNANQLLVAPDFAQPVADVQDPLELTWVMPVQSRRYRMMEGRKQHVEVLAAEVESGILRSPSKGLREEWLATRRARYGKA